MCWPFIGTLEVFGGVLLLVQRGPIAQLTFRARDERGLSTYNIQRSIVVTGVGLIAFGLWGFKCW